MIFFFLTPKSLSIVVHQYFFLSMTKFIMTSYFVGDGRYVKQDEGDLFAAASEPPFFHSW